MSVAPARHRFSVEEFDRMVTARVFREDEGVELIGGEIVEMTPVGSQHAGCVNALTHLFHSAVGSRLVVTVQNPLRLSPDSQPQPDLAIVKPREDFYRTSHPTAADALLVVEVADTSAAFDRGTKLGLYARAGVPEVWLVDLSTGRVEIFTEPSPEGYHLHHVRTRGEQARAIAVPELSLPVDVILGA